MYNKHKKPKNPLKELKQNTSERNKNIRNSATRTPKHLDSGMQRKSPQLSKFKSQPIRPNRQMTCSLLPPQIQSLDHQNQLLYKAYKTNKTNTSAADIPYSNSQKTIAFHKIDLCQKTAFKYDRTNQRPAPKKSKIDFELKIESRGALTTRKNSGSKKLILDTLLRKTERVLKKYQKKEQQWIKERATLIDEIEQLKKKKNTGHTLTSSTSSYINKRHLY